MNDRPMRLQRQPTIKVTALPTTAGLWPPVNGMLAASLLPPAPARSAPKARLAVAPVFNEGGKLLLRHRGSSHGKGVDFHSVRPLLIIEDKRLFRRGSEPKRAAGNFGIPR